MNDSSFLMDHLVDFLLFLPNLMFFIIFLVKCAGGSMKPRWDKTAICTFIVFVAAHFFANAQDPSPLNRLLEVVAALGVILVIRGLDIGRPRLWFFAAYPYLPGLALWSLAEYQPDHPARNDSQ